MEKRVGACFFLLKCQDDTAGGFESIIAKGVIRKVNLQNDNF